MDTCFEASNGLETHFWASNAMDTLFKKFKLINAINTYCKASNISNIIRNNGQYEQS